MSLLRRRIRSQLLREGLAGGVRLTTDNVQSHVNGSVTVAARRNTAFGRLPDEDTLESKVLSQMEALGHEGIYTLRKGSSQGGSTLYVTITSEALVEEAANRYGVTVLQAPLRVLMAAARTGSTVEETVAAEAESTGVSFEELMAEYTFETVELPELEPSEV
jgi:hypothetical protein